MTTPSNDPTAHVFGREPNAEQLAELLTVRQVASLLGGCSTRHVRRLYDSGRMPRPIKLGNLLRWRKREVLAWIENGCEPLRPAKGSAR